MTLLSSLLQIYSLIVLGRVLISWFPNLDANNPVARFLYEATEPLLRPIRQALPQNLGLDFSPLILLVGIQVVDRLLLRLL